MYYQHNKAVKTTKSLLSVIGSALAVIMIAGTILGLQGASQAKGGGAAAILPGDNKQVVTGTTAPCATTTIDSGATVKATSGVDPNTGEPVTQFGQLTMRGLLTNCSTSYQGYYIEFSEPLSGAVDTLGQPTCALNLGYGQWSVGDYLMKTGDKKGWSFTIDIASLAGVADPTLCMGTHTVKATVIDRTTGVVLQTLTTSYSVTL